MWVWFGVSLGLFILTMIILVIDIVNDIDLFREFSSVIGIIAFVSTAICSVLMPKYYSSYNKHVCDILSLKRESAEEGSFILGTGRIEKRNYYFYYYQEDKGIKLGKVDSEEAYIIQTNEMTPSIYHIKEKKSLESNYYIYVPEGTIITTYLLD